MATLSESLDLPLRFKGFEPSGIKFKRSVLMTCVWWCIVVVHRGATLWALLREGV